MPRSQLMQTKIRKPPITYRSFHKTVSRSKNQASTSPTNRAQWFRVQALQLDRVRATDSQILWEQVSSSRAKCRFEDRLAQAEIRHICQTSRQQLWDPELQHWALTANSCTQAWVVLDKTVMEAVHRPFTRPILWTNSEAETVIWTTLSGLPWWAAREVQESHNTTTGTMLQISQQTWWLGEEWT